MKMSRKMRWLVGGAAILVVAIAGWRLTRPQEPVYQGKTFSEWFEEIQISSGSFPDNSRPLRAVKAMGKDAVPFVMSRLRGSNSALHVKLESWLEHSLGVKKGSGYDRFVRAMFCLGELAADATEEVPELIEIAKGADSDRSNLAIRMIGRIRGRPDVAIPFLMQMTKGTDQFLGLLAVEALGEFGPAAKAAVPVIVDAARAERDFKRMTIIIYALERIDPEAAKKVQFKGGE